MTRRRKVIVGGLVLVLIGLLAFRALSAEGGDTTEVRADVVERRDLVERVSASGHIEPRRSVDISADISGRVVELAVEEGQQVARGDLLLRIDPTQYQAAVRRAVAQLSEARAQEARSRADHEQARRDWERLRQLKERTPDLVTDQETERARTEASVQESLWQAAQFAVEQAEAAVEEARDRLRKTVIEAPIDGRITRLNVEEGETAIVGTMNNPGSLLLTVADLSVMEAVVEVDETDVSAISIGDSAVVSIDAFPDREFAGRVTKVGDSSLQPRSQAQEAVDFEVRVTLEDAPDRIRPDLSASTDIITARSPDALAIPIIALTIQETGPDTLPDAGSETEGVFVIEDGHVAFRPVTVGIAGDNHFEVLEGLAEGDSVVAGSYQAIRELRDGARITVQSTGSS